MSIAIVLFRKPIGKRKRVRENEQQMSRRRAVSRSNDSRPLRVRGLTGCRRAGYLPILKNNFTTDYRYYAARFENFRLGNFHDVLREHGKIGELADFDRAFVFFFERGVSGPDREHL
jgi:hypothetical protein